MEWKERPFLNMIRFPVCMLFRMPVPAGCWEFGWENFFPSKLKNKRDLKAISALKLFLTWCFTIKIQRLTKNDFLSTRSRSEAQTPCLVTLSGKIAAKWMQSIRSWLWCSYQHQPMRSLYITVYTKPYFPPWCPWAARVSGSAYYRGSKSIAYTQKGGATWNR